jgi:hypothetical protein
MVPHTTLRPEANFLFKDDLKCWVWFKKALRNYLGKVVLNFHSVSHKEISTACKVNTKDFFSSTFLNYKFYFHKLDRFKIVSI